MPTTRTAQLATMSDAELNARLCSRKVTDALLERIAADAAEDAAIERAGDEMDDPERFDEQFEGGVR